MEFSASAEDLARSVHAHPTLSEIVKEAALDAGASDVVTDEDGHFIAPEDVTWARPVDTEGNRGDTARVAGDLLDVGDVIHVRALTASTGLDSTAANPTIPISLPIIASFLDGTADPA